MTKFRSISFAAGLVLVAGIAPLRAQQDDGHRGRDDHQPPPAQPSREHAPPQHAAPQPQPQPQRAAPQSPHQRGAPQREQQPQAQPQPQRVVVQPQRVVVPQQQAQQHQRTVVVPQPQAQAVEHQRVVAQPSPSRSSARLSEAEEHQRIAQQQQWNTQYEASLHQRMQNMQQQSVLLQQQRRMAQYRFEQAYMNRLREQQAQLNAERNYQNDPYYYTPNIYRYNRGGTYYETNQYGAQALQQAVNYGYQEGVAAGQADRQDGWRFDYQDSYAYQDANYGYSGMYVGQGDYNYYFRQGFQRGYEDGYYSRYQYGTNLNGSYSILGSLVSSILGLQTIR